MCCGLSARLIYSGLKKHTSLLISGFHRALLQSITLFSRQDALKYTKFKR